VSAPLVLDPSLSFPAIAAALGDLGFDRDEATRPLTPDTLPGEPELAAWTRGDGRLTYTFNPVVSLRVLAPSAAVSGEAVASVAARLPHLDAPAIARVLAETEPRRLLLGLFAARALGDRRLAGAVAPLLAHPDPTIARAARSTWDALVDGGEDAARAEALRLLGLLCQQAVPALAALHGPDGAAALAALHPRPEDYPRVFSPKIADAVQQAYETMWRSPPRFDPLRPGESLALDVFGCPARMLGSDNELSRRFPGGYRALAPLLQPDGVWFMWRLRAPPRMAGMRYDGLVRLDERWAWFPKPYRVAGEIVRAGRA
jgi:hypothetical protein